MTTCDVSLDNPAVSSRHCEVVVEEIQVVVRDLNSTNGTYINDVPIQEAILRVGDRLKLGTFELELEPPPIVAIPITALPEAPPTVLPDGRPCCKQHVDVAAQARCQGCGSHFCLECVHHIQRVGGAALHLCPLCGQRCAPLEDNVMPKPKKRSLMETLRDTIHLTLRGK
jgi:hypothetical protein